MHKEYLRRNLVHAGAVGVTAGIIHIHKRLGHRKHPPQWALKELERMLLKAIAAAHEVAQWRDNAPDRPGYVNNGRSDQEDHQGNGEAAQDEHRAGAVRAPHE